MRAGSQMRLYGYPVMPELVHLLLREPRPPRLARYSRANLGHPPPGFSLGMKKGTLRACPRIQIVLC